LLFAAHQAGFNLASNPPNKSISHSATYPPSPTPVALDRPHPAPSRTNNDADGGSSSAREKGIDGELDGKATQKMSCPSDLIGNYTSIDCAADRPTFLTPRASTRTGEYL
tara:strand:+ start:136 stop:465 length:330 start_codon:yes stop_codon:yes gene_type:complete